MIGSFRWVVRQDPEGDLGVMALSRERCQEPIARAPELALSVPGTLLGSFFQCLGSCIALQCPQGPLNLCGDLLTFLLDRHALCGQNLPVFSELFKLFSHVVHLSIRERRSNATLEQLLELFPF